MRDRVNRVNPAPGRYRAYLSAVCPGLICILLFAPAAAGAQNSSAAPGGALRIDKASEPTAINQPLCANDQMRLRDQQQSAKSFAAANAERRRQIADDSAKLVKLAAELNAELAKLSKDKFPSGVTRKVDAIERLAHSVRQKMIMTIGAD